MASLTSEINHMMDDFMVPEKQTQCDEPTEGKTFEQIQDECIDSEMLMEKELVAHMDSARKNYNETLLKDANFDQQLFNSQVFRMRESINKAKNITSELVINSENIASEYTIHANHINSIAKKERPEVGYDGAIYIGDMCVILNKKMKSTIPEVEELEKNVKILTTQLTELMLSTEGLIGSVNKLNK